MRLFWMGPAGFLSQEDRDSTLSGVEELSLRSFD